MLKPLAPIALLLALSANIHAAPKPVKFPPCDGLAINFVPLGSQTTASPFIVEHSYVGHESEKAGNVIGTGTCKVVVDPPPGPHKGVAKIGLTPSYASQASYGIAALPEWPTVASPGQEVAYTLSFEMTSVTPANDDWLDLVQLDFKRSDALSSNAGFSTVYRLRKASGRNSAIVTLIESRVVASTTGDKPAPTDRVVATLTTNGDGISTHYIALRWTQKVHLGAVSDEGENVPSMVETRVELLNENGTPVYATTLTNEFADSFSMGLLNHNTMTTVYPADDVIEFSSAVFSAQSTP